MKYLLPFLLCFFYSLSGFAQCKFDINTPIPVNADFFVQGNVSGLVNSDLADPAQGLCGIEIEFEHEFIGNLQIDLISPSGQVITLIGPQLNANFTNGTNWNITMNPCADPVSPDPGQPGMWTNSAPWAIGAAYTGSYYPAAACLEDFNLGSANGNWQLHILNGAFYVGEIISFSLIFCDPAGINCFPCDPKPGVVTDLSITFCEKDIALSTFIPDIAFPDGQADVAFYSYKYVIVSNGTIIQITDTPDWTTLNGGNYEIYGISYLTSYDANIITYDGGTFLNLLNFINSSIICGELTEDSLALTIYESFDRPLTQITICKGDTFNIGSNPYTTTMVINDTLQTEHGCDSIINIDLQVADLQTEILLDTIDCFINTVTLDTANFVTNGQILEFAWLDPQDNIISHLGNVDVSEGGLYHLSVTLLFGSIVCNFKFEAEILEQITPPLTPVLNTVQPCAGMQSVFSLAIDTLRNVTNWTFEGDPDIVYVSDSVYVTWTQPGNYNVCVFGINQCGSSDTVCTVINVGPSANFEIQYDSITCDATFDINFSGNQTDIFWFGDINQATYAANGDGSNVNGNLISPFEEVQLYYTGQVGGCDINGSLWIRQSPQPTYSGLHDTTVCDSAKVNFIIDHTGGNGILHFTWQGNNEQLNLDGVNDVLSLDVTFSQTLIIDSLTTSYSTCRDIQPQQFNFTVINSPQALISDTVSVCNAFSENGEPKYFLSDFIISGDNTGSWNITGLPGVSIINDSIDLNLLLAGTYEIYYTTNSAVLPCGEKSYKLVLKVEDCSCTLTAGIGESLLDLEICSNYGVLDLDSLYNPVTDVSWFIVDNSGIQVPLNNTLLVDQSLSGIQSIIIKTDQNWLGQCPDSLILTLEIAAERYAGDDMDLIFCASEILTIDLDTVLNNVVNSGLWIADPSTFPGITKAFNPSTHILEIEKLGSGDLRMYSIARSPNICANDTALLSLKVNPKPQINVNGSRFLDCTTLETLISVDGFDINNYNVTWEHNGIEFYTSTALDSQLVDEAGVYNFFVENMITGCLDTTAIIIETNADQIVDVGFDILSDCQSGSASFVINSVTGGSAPFLYSIDDSLFVPYTQFHNLEEGQHQIEIIDAKNCKFDLLFDVSSSGGLKLELGPDEFIKLGATSDYNIEFPVMFIEQLTTYIDGINVNVTDTFGVLTPDKTIVLKVVITDIFGCVHEDEKRIFVEDAEDTFIPNVFTPNDDGSNDVFYIPGNPQISEIVVFNIYDRWGNHIYGKNNFKPGEEIMGWDGNFEGKPMNPGVFVYFLEYKLINGTSQFKKGSLTLIR